MLLRLKMLVLRLWLKFSKVEHDLLRKEHVLAARAKVAVERAEHEAVVAAQAIDHMFERPLTEREINLVEVL